jgi:hypothetical protein
VAHPGSVRDFGRCGTTLIRWALRLIIVEVQVNFDGVDPDEFEIDDVELVEPTGDQSVSTSKSAGYPWK